MMNKNCPNCGKKLDNPGFYSYCNYNCMIKYTTGEYPSFVDIKQIIEQEFSIIRKD